MLCTNHYAHIHLLSIFSITTMLAIRFFANRMAAFCFISAIKHRNKKKNPMSNTGGTPVFAGFVGSSRTFKTSAFNHSAISAEEKPVSVIIAGFPAKVKVQNGLLDGLNGCFRAFWWVGTVFRGEWSVGIDLILDQTYGEIWVEKAVIVCMDV